MLLFFPRHCAVSTKAESMKISKSGINKNLQELNQQLQEVMITSIPDKKMLQEPKNLLSACAIAVPAGWEPAASALLSVLSGSG